MKSIELSSEGAEVFVLQRLLNKSSFSIDSDGDFGSQTLEAVTNFQSQVNLEPNGIVGTLTWDALFDNTKDLPHEGIDISHYDFDEGKMVDLDYIADNFWFCYTKGTQGSTIKDPKFKNTFGGLEKKQVLRGVYHFFQFGNVQDQIDNFNSLGIDYCQKGVLPPVLDIEPIAGFNPTVENIDAYIKELNTWLTAIENVTNKKTIIYTSKNMWDNILKSPSGFEHHPLWVASYTTGMKPVMPSSWKNCCIWQYTETGAVNFVKDYKDVNHLTISYQHLLELAGF